MGRSRHGSRKKECWLLTFLIQWLLRPWHKTRRERTSLSKTKVALSQRFTSATTPGSWATPASDRWGQLNGHALLFTVGWSRKESWWLLVDFLLFRLNLAASRRAGLWRLQPCTWRTLCSFSWLPSNGLLLGTALPLGQLRGRNAMQWSSLSHTPKPW